MIDVVTGAIDIRDLIGSVADPAAGGTAVFIGTTRNHAGGKGVLHLEYEQYEPMARQTMDRIAAAVQSRWQICRISMVHRIGRVDIGEASVAIAVSAPHRKEAFEACRYVIDAVKRDVPIWKKEYFSDGEVRWGRQSDG